MKASPNPLKFSLDSLLSFQLLSCDHGIVMPCSWSRLRNFWTNLHNHENQPLQLENVFHLHHSRLASESPYTFCSKSPWAQKKPWFEGKHQSWLDLTRDLRRAASLRLFIFFLLLKGMPAFPRGQNSFKSRNMNIDVSTWIFLWPLLQITKD